MSDLKAYAVREDCENTGGIYYATSNIVARKAGSHEYNGSELGGMSCRRAPWADKYAPGPCPKLVMIDHGWWFECHGCCAKMSCDAADDSEEDGGNDPNRYIERGSAVYCSIECRTRYRSEQAMRKRLERKAIRDLAAALLLKLPDVVPVTIRRKDNWRPHASVVKQDGVWKTQQCVVSFDWPGRKIGFGTFRFDKIGEEPHVAICHGDMDAWNAWRASA